MAGFFGSPVGPRIAKVSPEDWQRVLVIAPMLFLFVVNGEV